MRDRIAQDRPTLAICLGLQLLCRSSAESPCVRGLGVVDADVDALRGARVPQFGWNDVTPAPGCSLVEPGFAYFANSYALRAAPEGWAASMAKHGEPFVAAVERGALLACQFHPELSGLWGDLLLRRWLRREAVTRC